MEWGRRSLGSRPGWWPAWRRRRLLLSMLYRTEVLDPTVFAAVRLTLLLVGVVACMLPAWRASRFDPMQSLRETAMRFDPETTTPKDALFCGPRFVSCFTWIAASALETFLALFLLVW